MFLIDEWIPFGTINQHCVTEYKATDTIQWPFFINKRLLFLYTDNSLDLCIKKKEAI